MFHSVIPIEVVLGYEPAAGECMSVEGGYLMIGNGRVQRLITSEPSLYLRAEYMPGAPWKGKTGQI